MESRTALEKALAAQRASITRAALESDTVLLTDFMVKDTVNRVRDFSTIKLKDEGNAALNRPAPIDRSATGPGAKVAQRIYTAQNSAHVTIMTVQGTSSTAMLPAGVPVIDHLAAWASITPGWNTITPQIEQLRARRAPSTEPTRHPEVLELALGTSTAQEYAHACEWVKTKHQQTRDSYGILLPAADVECLQIEASKNYQSLEQVLADIVLSSGDVIKTFSLPAPPSRGVTAASTISLPVLFMYGSIDWQLHICLGAGHTADGRSITFICGDPLPPQYLELIALLEPAVGTGIEKDYEDFFGTVSAFWPSHGAKPAKPIELARVTMLAGCAISHVSVLQLAYTFLGGFLCKDWRASTGDRLWA
jgi:hypothetical protein